MWVLPPGELSWAWPRVRRLLEPALAHAGDTYGPAEVLEALRAGDAWLLVDLPITLAVVAEMVEYPRRSVLRAWLAGADGPAHDWAPVVAALEGLGRREGCGDVEIIGREGWARALPGFKRAAVIMRKEIRP